MSSVRSIKRIHIFYASRFHESGAYMDYIHLNLYNYMYAVTFNSVSVEVKIILTMHILTPHNHFFCPALNSEPLPRQT